MSSRPEGAKKRRLSRSPDGRPKKRVPEGQDDLPQPYNAMDLAPAKKIPSGDGRKLKRPGQRARITEAEREAIRQRQIEREREQRELEERQREAEKQHSAVNDVVRQHYNAVPERGRDWRRTESHIKGLRAFNNWVKSCVIQRYSPSADFAHPGAGGPPADLLVLDLGCGKGGDLMKWTNAPQPVALYVGIDHADVSIDQATDRYRSMGARGGRGRGRPPRMDARFFVMDCFTDKVEQIPLIRDVGFGADGPLAGDRGFDVVSMMFCMHYAYESEEKARTMLRNVAGALKKGGRFIGTIPNSDVLSAGVVEFNKKMKEKKALREEKAKADAEEKEKKDAEGDGEGKGPKEEDSDKEEGEADEDEEEEGEAEQSAEWGNKIYRVRFPGETPEDGIFRPPYGWKYNFFLDEAVDQVPEYVVPWEAFRALAEEFNLELQYHEPFRGVWETEKDDRELGMLSERMGVRERGGGPLLVSEPEMEAASFYLAFCFYKV